ncbi:hypothetical protein MMPV_004707 [Pyropia vietnamensis]
MASHERPPLTSLFADALPPAPASAAAMAAAIRATAARAAAAGAPASAIAAAADAVMRRGLNAAIAAAATAAAAAVDEAEEEAAAATTAASAAATASPATSPATSAATAIGDAGDASRLPPSLSGAPPPAAVEAWEVPGGAAAHLDAIFSLTTATPTAPAVLPAAAPGVAVEAAVAGVAPGAEAAALAAVLTRRAGHLRALTLPTAGGLRLALIRGLVCLVDRSRWGWGGPVDAVDGGMAAGAAALVAASIVRGSDRSWATSRTVASVDMVDEIGAAVRDAATRKSPVGEVEGVADAVAASTTIVEAVAALASVSARAPALAAPDANLRPLLDAVATILSAVEQTGTLADADRPSGGGTPGREGGRADRGSKRRRSDVDAAAGALAGDRVAAGATAAGGEATSGWDDLPSLVPPTGARPALVAASVAARGPAGAALLVQLLMLLQLLGGGAPPDAPAAAPPRAVVAGAATLPIWIDGRRKGIRQAPPPAEDPRSAEALYRRALAALVATHPSTAAALAVIAGRDGAYTSWATGKAQRPYERAPAAAVVSPARRDGSAGGGRGDRRLFRAAGGGALLAGAGSPMSRDRRVAALRAPSPAVVAAASPVPAGLATETAAAEPPGTAADTAAPAGGGEEDAPAAWRRLRQLRGQDASAMAAVAAGLAGVGRPRGAGVA